MSRVVQAGAVPVTWLQVLLEFQRDWARRETYDAVIAQGKPDREARALAKRAWILKRRKAQG